MPDASENPIIRIGECRFDRRSHELWRDGVCTRLPRRLSQLLWRLVQAAPAVVLRQTLIDEVWQRRMVEDDVLSRAIAELRRALGDDTKTPRYIETIPKAGYRFCASVDVDSPQSLTDGEATLLSTASQATEPADVDAVIIRRSAFPAKKILIVLLSLVALATIGIWVLKTNRSTALSSEDLSRLRPFTSGAGWESRPDISPDGRWVVYSESEVGSDSSRLVLQDIEGNHREVLEASPRFNIRPAFEGDGKRIAFLHLSNERCELRVRSIPGGNGHTLAECALAVPSSPSWSRTQPLILFTAPASEGHAAGLSLVDVQSGAERPLTQPTLLQGPDRDPRWVPGGDAITFARGPDGEQYLMKLDLDAMGEPKALVNAGRLQGHAWSPDGKQLLVATDQPGYRTLVLYDANGKQIEVLNARGARYPAWADNGELVIELALYDANIWRLALDAPDAKPTSIIASTRYDASPTLSFDDRELAFVSTRNDFEQIFVAAPDGSNQQKLAMPDGQRWSRPSFSPDAAYLLVTGYDENNRHWLYRYERASGRIEQLRALGEEASSGRYTADGNWIVYMRRAADGNRNLWRARLNDLSSARRIAGTEGVEHFALSSDAIVFRRSDQTGFFLLPWPEVDVQSRELFSEVEPITSTAWALRERHLYAAVIDERVGVLKRWDIDSGLVQTLASGIDADAVGPSLVVDQNETAAWFARTDSVNIDLMRLPPRQE